MKAVRKLTTVSNSIEKNENNKIADKPHIEITKKSKNEAKNDAKKLLENPVTYLVPPVQANDNHHLVCKNCKEAFEYQSYLKDHLKSKQCANISCKEDHDHLNQTVCKPFLNRDDAVICVRIKCSVNMYNHNEDRNQYVCKQAVPKKCKSRFAIRKGHRYLQNGKFVKVWVVVGCKVHTHGPYMKVRQFCDLEHEHELVDEVIDNRDDSEGYAKELLDYDYNHRDRKPDYYIKFWCPVPGCGIYLKVNYKDEKNVHIRGCLKHTGHEPRNVRRDLKCFTDHDHEILKRTFGSLEEAMAFIYSNKLDAQFKIQKNYSTQVKVYKVFQCARKGRYLAKIDTKKNKGMI